MPQGCTFDPLLFFVYINNLGVNADGTYTHCYADDTVLYSCAPSLTESPHNLPLHLIFCSFNFQPLKLIIIYYCSLTEALRLILEQLKERKSKLLLVSNTLVC